MHTLHPLHPLRPLQKKNNNNASLDDWLGWQETLHPKSIDLGLQRVKQVLHTLELSKPDYFIITVAGTNGKGSCVALLESILLQAGYKVGTYTSPHLIRYNERIKVLGKEVEDQQLCDSFARINNARNNASNNVSNNTRAQGSKTTSAESISLTYFEFGTLAAIDIFSQTDLDIVILEVGLGGRLDAVNILDADIALIASLDIDHTDWLGEDRESIATEKAGIFRKSKPVVIIESDIPGSMLMVADELSAPVYCMGQDFGFYAGTHAWSWWSNNTKRNALNFPALRGEQQLHNAAGVLMVLELLVNDFPVNQQDLRNALASVSLAGRFQVIPGEVLQILDVAHNPQAAMMLSEALKEHHCSGRTYAIVGMLQDKDTRGVLAPLAEIVDHWIVVDLHVARGEKAANIKKCLYEIYSTFDAANIVTANNGVNNVANKAANTMQTPKIEYAQSVTQGCQVAQALASESDRLVIFGSFFTVAQALHQTL